MSEQAANEEKKDKQPPAAGVSNAGTQAAGAAAGAAPAEKPKDSGIQADDVDPAHSAGKVIRKPGERGKVHSFKVNSTRFVIDAKYSPLKPLGRGAYGVVVSALDMDANKKVAIKKIPNAFDDLVDAKRILREVKMLHHFKHENIVGLVDLVDPPPGPFEDIYMVLEFMETDLHKIIYSKNKLTDEHIQYFIYQTLKALKFIHSAHVIHRDLKPSNLLLNGNCDLKICDFGLARGVKEESNDYELTEYVVTRWYRAPEVMCSCQDYDYKIDVWAVGCILAELNGRKPLFPGDDYIKQMNLIFSVLGTPSEEDMAFISNDRAADYVRSLKPQPKVPFKNIYKKASPLCLDLMEKMLVFNPRNRISVDEALAHPYFKDLHNPKLEVTCDKRFDFEFENVKMTKDVLQEFMWDEIYDFRPFLRNVRGRGRPGGSSVEHPHVPSSSSSSASAAAGASASASSAAATEKKSN